MAEEEQAEAQETQETQERQIFQLNEAKYFADSITENGKKLIDSINIVGVEIDERGKKLEKVKLQQDIANIAKDALIGQLEALTSEFEKVPETAETTEEKAPAA